jgi:hypothetical protein
MKLRERIDAATLRLLKSRYCVAAMMLVVSAVVMAAGLTTPLPFFNVADAWLSGTLFTIALFNWLTPLRIHDLLQDLPAAQRAHFERQAQEILERVIADAKRRGIIPPGVGIDMSMGKMLVPEDDDGSTKH